jgi:hypothetical protein
LNCFAGETEAGTQHPHLNCFADGVHNVCIRQVIEFTWNIFYLKQGKELVIFINREEV